MGVQKRRLQLFGVLRLDWQGMAGRGSSLRVDLVRHEPLWCCLV